MAQVRLIRAQGARVELHDALGLTGMECSVNTLPAGVEIPFVHYHTENEELYLVLEGEGFVWLDGEVTAIAAGDCFKVDPEGHRSLKAGASGLRYVCVQTRAGSLRQFTQEDARIADGEKPVW